MFKESAEFDTPPDETVIWRYMDYTKFIALLEDKALFFCRGDKFRDRFEGSLPKQIALEQNRLWRDLQGLDGKIPEVDEESQRQFNQLGELDRQFVGINCWYLGDEESDAMWQLYLKGQGEGVAIRSTIGRLKRAIVEPRRDVLIGRVRYIDYGAERFEIRSPFSRFLHKRIGFAHENEVRAMTRIHAKIQSGESFDYIHRQPEVKHGLNISVDLRSLIDQIVIAPGAKWLELVTLKVIDRHGLRVNVQCTSLDADPTF